MECTKRLGISSKLIWWNVFPKGLDFGPIPSFGGSESIRRETSGHWLGGKLAKLSEMDRAKWDSTSGPRRHPPPWWLWGCPRWYRATQNSWSLYWNQTYSSKELSHIVFLGHMGDQKKEGLDVPRKDRRKIICCANNTIDEVTKSLLVNWNYYRKNLFEGKVLKGR